MKRAKDSEFRVQQDFGGRVEANRGPILMELELIEPELYFVIAPEAATRMAELIVTLIS